MNSVEKRKLAIFKSSCRVYEKELERSQKLLLLYPDLKKMVEINSNGEILEKCPVFLNDFTVDPLIVKEYELVQFDIWFVENNLGRIEKLCGSEARTVCFELFVQQETQEACASDHGLTRDQLQYRLSKWMGSVFGGRIE